MRKFFTLFILGLISNLEGGIGTFVPASMKLIFDFA